MDAALPPFVQALCQESAYAHAVEQPIQLLQTHISYVFLTGEYAYKVKKPADFGFLNFTTLEKRLFYCQEELRLNSRLSGELYLAVVPIFDLGSDRYRVGTPEELTHTNPTDKIVDYAVQMRQFQQSQLFSQLFAADQLTPELMDTLGKELAHFHQTAATSPDISAFGSPEAVAQVARNSYSLGENFIGRSQTQAQFTATKAFSDRFFAEHHDWLEKRQRDHKIRECHGDLHLNNICLHHGKVQIFDCIEFNQEFRNIDGIYDAAFLVMDLQFRQRPDLAQRFLNAYLEWSNDYEGAVLLPLYLSMRAYIRGNVNSLALNDPAIPAADKETIQATAAAYFKAAYDYTQVQPGKLYVTCGLSGAGKTTLARYLSTQIGAIHIRSDAVRKHLAGVPLDQRSQGSETFAGGIYTPEMTAKTYDLLLELGLFLVAAGQTVILDAKYDRQFHRERVIEGAKNQGTTLEILHCQAPMTVMQQRLGDRRGDIAEATPPILEQQAADFEPFTTPEQAYVRSIDTTQPIHHLHLLEK
ncbi:AAA family ATPase [Candidatus Synechococcus calcipolaris G9]|uniref:AAA family ATPase n=1 Tax=Candidatus Synechococcus calcipolaris G9 TaxID=1497997 RepID=A0ABT6F1X8_9SYNE|nr:bifunctional aminoglycoside phosphotransferase/ATP-binding protein [Candidatus Synechococcus calcipolaris]MDG2991844.1 AAA family ATPase [Candidatus Synechococcus calcipolaris G9]